MSIAGLVVIFGLLLPSASQPAAAPSDPDVEKMQSLLKNPPMDAEGDVVEGSEAVTLARKPKVADWLRKRIRDLAPHGGSDSQYLYMILLQRGASSEDIQLLANLLATPSKFSGDMIGPLARTLLERAPFSFSKAIEKGILGPLIDMAPGFGHETADAVWLAAQRLPAAKIGAALETAFSRPRAPENRGFPVAVLEVLLLGPGGKPIPRPAWAERTASWGGSALVWPDGKLRVRTWISGKDRTEVEYRLEPAVPGYRVPEAVALKLKEGINSHTVTLAPRARVKGKLTPAPKAPLFVLLEEKAPAGQGATRYRQDTRGLTVPVREDGTFWAPIHSHGKVLLVFTIDGDVLLALPVNPPPDGDLDLGPVAIPPSRDLVAVPVLLEWPLGSTAGNAINVALTWRPKTPGKPEAATKIQQRFSRPCAAGIRMRIGMARNLAPGAYEVEAVIQRWGRQGDVLPVRIPFTVSASGEPLLLKPQAKPQEAPPPAVAGKEAPPLREALRAAEGSVFRLGPAGDGEVFLLSVSEGKLFAQKGKDGAFDPPRQIWKSTGSGQRDPTAVDFLLGSDGLFHVFLNVPQAEGLPLLHGRLMKSGEPWGPWAPIGDRKPGGESWHLSAAVPRKGGLDLYTEVWAAREWRRVVGTLEGGKYRTLSTSRILVHQGPRSLITDARGAAFLLIEGPEGRFSWRSLERTDAVPAATAPDGGTLQRETHLLLPDGDFYLSVFVRDRTGPAGRDNLWVARGKLGGALAARGAVLLDGFSQTQALAASPRGDVYLFAFAAQRLTAWKASGADFPQKPLYFAWQGVFSRDLQVVFTGPGKAEAAWSDQDGIYVGSLAIGE